MTNIIAAAVILLLFSGASYYIYKEKKKGTHCIGCPMAGKCAKAKAMRCASMHASPMAVSRTWGRCGKL